MQRRRIQVSLSGPWGPEKSFTYIKARIEFPTNYPTSAAPALTLEQTASLRDEITDQIYMDAKSIASSFMSHQRMPALVEEAPGERGP